jgi:hypothetical protein
MKELILIGGTFMKNEESSMGIIEMNIDEEKLKEVEDLFIKYSPILKPNRKSVAEIVEYIKAKYPVEEDNSPRAKRLVEVNVLNSFSKDMEAKEIPLKITVLNIKNEDTAKVLYDFQEQEHLEFIDKMKHVRANFEGYPFENSPIRIDVEENSDYMVIEGSGLLADEVTIFRGLDEKELKDKYLVANYVKAIYNLNLKGI